MSTTNTKTAPLTVEGTIHFARRGKAKELRLGPAPVPSPTGRVLRVARLMALALKFEQLICEGAVKDYAELARLGHVTRNQLVNTRARVIDFRTATNNRFLVVRELKIQGLRTPHYNRRADLVCFVNGLPLVFVELKAVYVNIRAAFDGNLTDYNDPVP